MAWIESSNAFKTLGSVTTLGELGVVDPEQVRIFLKNPSHGKGLRVRDVLNLEAWAQAHSQP